MSFFSIAADVLWIIALSIMAASTRTAWMRMKSSTKVPMQFGKDNKVSFRLSRDLGLLLPIILAFLFGAVLLWGHRSVTDMTYDVIFFGLRATIAAMITLMHMQWLNTAVATLDAEGELTR